MAFRNPLRPGSAVLSRTLLAACFGATIGCNAYTDELLRHRDDGDGSKHDTVDGSAGSTTKDGAPTSDTAWRDDGDAASLDATSTDAPSGRDAGTVDDVTAADGAPGDAGSRPDADATTSDGTARDAVIVSDAPGVPTDANTSPDADAAPPGADANAPDANGRDARDAFAGTDVDARDAGTLDVQVDAVTPPPTFRAVRVGDGATTLSAASTAVFVEERRWDGSLVGSALALPTTANGNQHPVSLAGTATSEGALSRSLDARFLTLAGYATAPGRASIASSTDVDRVVARIDAAGDVDTSTLLGNAFSGTNVRSAATADGAAFWIGGAEGGVWYAPLGGAGIAQIVATPDNVRWVALFGDQLYGTSGTSPMTNVFTVGSGKPTSGVQKVAALAGMPQSGTSPYAFALFDLSPAVAGLDTLYLADDRSPVSDGSGGGVQKWTFDGNAWSRVATFSDVSGGSSSFRGLAGTVTASGVTLVASTSESGANRLVVFIDDGRAKVTGTVVATAPSNTLYRGVALSPQP